MFMHGSAYNLELTFWHLFSNMFALWMFGSILENLWGPKRFTLFYFLCGLGAALLHLAVLHYEYSSIETAFAHYQQNPTLDQFQLFLQQHFPRGASDPTCMNSIHQSWSQNPGDVRMSNSSIDCIYRNLHGYTVGGEHISGMFDEATVGASGAVFGILFAFAYLFPNTLLYISFLIPVKAKYVIAVYALFELYSGIQNSAGDNVAHFAHLGGMVVGFIILKIWNRKVRNKFY
jgi:membrane associated rhomboid family serine protease